MTRFAAVILDVDSTLTGIEGIDWLASLRTPAVAAAIARLTDDAMRGAIPLETVYGKRLEMVAPSRAELEKLSVEYQRQLAPGASTCVKKLIDKGVDCVLVSGGLREAILPLAKELGLQETAVHAVPIFFDVSGRYKGFDAASHLTKQFGKRDTVSELNLPRPALAVGDGITDSEIRPAVNAFAAYTGFVRRESVVRKADYVIESFSELTKFILDE